ncbi:MAG: type II toxin-antitoxin system HicB family antitoxin [Bacteroidales bacterium]|jgi:predicted RNase H-like HicB family nuclease|nr:type II toxin-antitoxin system HicB family antitoxin [Bacteroidales bacterium]MDD4429744.1 type II toxin-antitoxin system HicB family antitoxin [Paludibacter sp.]NLO49674.1 type II toxin-antitoxin system HicB family antitoxin [Bacteroidales bacterium]
MKGEFTVIIEKDSEGYLVASVPELPGCHTQATSFDQLNERIKEAIELCILENEGEIDRNQFIGIQRIAI